VSKEEPRIDLLLRRHAGYTLWEMFSTNINIKDWQMTEAANMNSRTDNYPMN